LVTARVRVREAEGRVTLAELSGALGVHRAHLARAFRDHYGTTIGMYARRLRVQRAVAMIQLRDLPLAEIAAASGFADQSHMTRAVSGALGLPPGRLRGTLHATPVQDGAAKTA